MTDIIIMDLDGVLCDNSHRAHLIPPADQQHRNEAWRPFVSECINDAPIVAGITMYKALAKTHKVVIVTSRQDLFANESRSWLKNNINTRGYPDVMFRIATDHSTPTAYKRDVLKTLRGRGYNILFAVDDDPAIVAMYNAEGVATFQPSTRCSSCK